jgi:hypothetical protein
MPARLWSGLSLVEAELELAERARTDDGVKHGLTVDDVIRAGENDAELGPTMRLFTSKEAKLRKALKHYGDEGHPIPIDQTGSVYDGPGLVEHEPHWIDGAWVPDPNGQFVVIDGELVRRAPDPAPENVVEEPAPRLVRLLPLEDDERDVQGSDAGVKPTPGAKSRWRRSDLETIIVKQRTVSARKLAESGDLVESIRHQRISELRARDDIRVENGRLVLPPGTTGDGGWITLPKLG